jgi:signal transduction histidine kinase
VTWPIDSGYQAITFYPAVIVSTLLGGIFSGVLTVAFCFLAMLYLFTPPYLTFSIEAADEFLALLFYSIFSIAICLIIHRLQNANMKANRLVTLLNDREMELAKTLEKAEKTAREKGRFFAAASHDLRQPFQAMRLFHSVLQQTSNDPDRQAEILKKLDMAMAAGENMLSSLLDIAKLDAGQEQLIIEPVNLPDVLDLVVSDCAPMAAGKGLKLKKYCRDESITTDRTVLRRIVNNLTTNAIRYTNKGGILISCRPRRNRLLIEVWDTGIGISPDKIDMIFEEFYQVGSSEPTRDRGLGLGLSIVKRLCGLMNFQISVRSNPGKGSVFSISLRPDAASRSDANRLAPGCM